jgi:hypothetical protein
MASSCRAALVTRARVWAISLTTWMFLAWPCACPSDRTGGDVGVGARAHGQSPLRTGREGWLLPTAMQPPLWWSGRGVVGGPEGSMRGGRDVTERAERRQGCLEPPPTPSDRSRRIPHQLGVSPWCGRPSSAPFRLTPVLHTWPVLGCRDLPAVVSLVNSVNREGNALAPGSGDYGVITCLRISRSLFPRRALAGEVPQGWASRTLRWKSVGAYADVYGLAGCGSAAELRCPVPHTSSQLCREPCCRAAGLWLAWGRSPRSCAQGRLVRRCR